MHGLGTGSFLRYGAIHNSRQIARSVGTADDGAAQQRRATEASQRKEWTHEVLAPNHVSALFLEKEFAGAVGGFYYGFD